MSAAAVSMDVLEKIEKIQALMSRAGTQEEAEAASAALQRLLTKHNLELFDVEQRLGNGKHKSEFVREHFNLKHQSGWRRDLLHVVAVNNFGKITYTQGSGWTSIVAEKRQVPIIIETYLRLEKLLWKMSRDASDREYANPSYEYSLEPRAWLNSYRNGFVWGLNRAMQAAKRDEIAQHEGGSALVVVKEEELNAAFSEFYPKLGKASSRDISSSAGYHAGMRAGQNVSFGKSVGSGSKAAIGR